MSESKSLYELKQDSIKTKYRRKIEEMEAEYGKDKEVLSSEELHGKYDPMVLELANEAETEVKEYKKEKSELLKGYRRKIRNNVIIADILLVLGIAILTFGIYMKHKMDVNPKCIEVLLIIFGSLIMVSAGIFFGSADFTRQKQHDYFQDSYSESELASTRSMVREFKERMTEENNV